MHSSCGVYAVSIAAGVVHAQHIQGIHSVCLMWVANTLHAQSIACSYK